jgi:serine/threonine-protein kinase
VSASLREQLQRTLGSSYALERELGGGGMSRVFMAREAALERDVVVKVLAPELAAGVSAERFAREIKLAAALQQANIVPLLSAGETDGLPYYTMPFVDGLSLRARLERNGPLPVGEVLHVLHDVARALAYAHEHGVVHRDIKPENILLSGDAAVVTDFGIAKALAASKTQAPGGTLTQVGTSIGTPAYMAPDQAAGDPATDHRADLYALGCVAYEMLAGMAPFADRAPHQLFAAHLNEAPAPLAAKRTDAPIALAALVMRCLEKDPAKRPQSAREILEALDGVGPVATSSTVAASLRTRRRRLGLASVACAVLAIAALGARAALRTRGGTDAIAGALDASVAAVGAHSIAVLPFENRGDSADAYFAEGITDAVRGKLTALPGVSVVARASSVSYPPGKQVPAVVARDLGVRYLLTGTVRFAGTGVERRVQVSPELVEVVAGHAPESRWQQPFDAAVKDVFAVQARIAGDVASAMQVALGAATKAQLAGVPTGNDAAYDAFLRGEAIRNASPTDPRSLRRGVAAYEEAVRHDSTMAQAWAGLSSMLALLYANATPTPELARSAGVAAQRAVALDSAASDGWAALSYYHRMVSHDLARALEAAGRARANAPSNASVRVTAAAAEAELGQLEAAARDLAEAARLDPRNVRVWGNQLVVLLRLGRVADARAAAERELALAPTSISAVEDRILAEVAAGDVSAAGAGRARGARVVAREAHVADVAPK